MKPHSAARAVALCSGGNAVKLVHRGTVTEIEAAPSRRLQLAVSAGVQAPAPIEKAEERVDVAAILLAQRAVADIGDAMKRCEAAMAEMLKVLEVVTRSHAEIVAELRKPAVPVYDKNKKLVGIQRVDSIKK